LIDGQQVSVADAASVAGFDIPVPDTTVAGPGNLTATWAAADRRQVALVFDQGKVDVVMQPAVYKDPASEYNTFISENNAKAAIGDVNGQPALVISPDTDSNQTNPAWVEFDLNGTDINIFSVGYTTDQLLAVADSMAQPTSSPSPSASSRNTSPSASPSPGSS
jgi:hypothetical protein